MNKDFISVNPDTGNGGGCNSHIRTSIGVQGA